MFLSAESMDSAQAPSGHSAAVARKFELLCRFHTEHRFAPQTVVTQLGFGFFLEICLLIPSQWR